MDCHQANTAYARPSTHCQRYPHAARRRRAQAVDGANTMLRRLQRGLLQNAMLVARRRGVALRVGQQGAGGGEDMPGGVAIASAAPHPSLSDSPHGACLVARIYSIPSHVSAVCRECLRPAVGDSIDWYTPANRRGELGTC